MVGGYATQEVEGCEQHRSPEDSSLKESYF